MRDARRRAAVAVLTLAVVLGGLAMVGGQSTAADARLTLAGATVAPPTPAAGAPMTVSATVRYSAGSNSSFDLETVRLVRTDTGETVGSASDLGTLTAGETLSVPVTITVDEPGVSDFRIVAEGSDADGEGARATRPLTVGVEPAEPQFETELEQLVTGAERSVAVEVSNPTTSPLRDVEIGVVTPGSDVGIRRTVPALAAGATETVNLTVRGPDADEATVELVANYTDPTGAQRSVTYTRTVEVVDPTVDVGLRATRASADGGGQVPDGLPGLVGGGAALQDDSESESGASGPAQVDVTVTNFGTAPITDVELQGRTADGALVAAVGRFAVADRLPPGDSATVTVDLTRVRVDDLRFVAAYDTPGGEGETVLASDYAAPSGAAELTGLDVTVSEDGRVNVSGNLANTGTAPVTGAVVAVRPTESVRPAYPQRNYFVGTVGASEFVPFDVTASADVENASAVTLAVTYTADGNRTAETVAVPLPDETDDDSGATQSLGVPLVALVGVGVAATAVFVWRRTDR
jgi:hypothetical protein